MNIVHFILSDTEKKQAIAIVYDETKHHAPVVIAKRENTVAINMLDTAQKHGVKIIYDNDLMQSLYYESNINSVIPENLFAPIAEIISKMIKSGETKNLINFELYEEIMIIEPHLHSRLREINIELTAIEKRIMKTALRLDANLGKELENDVDEIIDYELDVTIDCYGVDGSDYPLCTLEEGLKQCSIDDNNWGLNDGENHNEFQFRENHPMFGEQHCWLFHCLYDHYYLTWEEIASIQNFWIDIKPRYQYRCDMPDSCFSPPTRHLIYSDNYQSLFDDVMRNSMPDFANPFAPLRKISRSLWGDTARLTLKPMNDEELSIFHSPEYLQSLRQDRHIIGEIIGCTIPSSITMAMVNEYLIDAVRSMCAGTVAAAKLALETGWAINIGGGFADAKKESGENYCFFNDYALAANYLRKTNPEFKIMYIDLDSLIDSGVEHLLTLIDSKQPDMIFYHAGSRVSINPEEIREHHLWVFKEASRRSIPIMMCLGNVYGKENYPHIVESIEAIVELMAS